MALIGCKVGRPNWWNPGSAPAQQHRATIYDPYADNDAGPEIVGARPREFAKPRPEAVRSQPLTGQVFPWGYPTGQGGIPSAPVPMPAAPAPMPAAPFPHP
jgi:hypothetical protein